MLFGELKISEEEVANGYTVAVVNNVLNELFQTIADECPSVELTRNDGESVSISELVNTDAPFVVDYWNEVAEENGYVTPSVSNSVFIERIQESPVIGQIYGEVNRARSQIRQMEFIQSKRKDDKYKQAISQMRNALAPYEMALSIANTFAEGFSDE